jgi:hypothetical protein
VAVSSMDASSTGIMIVADSHMSTLGGDGSATAINAGANVIVDAGLTNNAFMLGLAFAAAREGAANAGHMGTMFGGFFGSIQRTTDAAATTDAMASVVANANINSGHVDLVVPFASQGGADYTNASISALYDFYAFGVDLSTATITNRWGLMIEPDSVGVKNNFMANALRIGDTPTAPSTTLDVDGDTTMRGHITATTTAPTALVNANAGTSASCTLSNASDVAGKINLTEGSGSWASGAQCAITFNAAYAVAPICVFSASSANAATAATTVKPYITTSASVMTISFASADAAATSYVWSYHCLETQ